LLNNSLQPRIPMLEFKDIEKRINSVEKDLLNAFYEIDNNFKEHPFYVLKEFEEKEVYLF
jgi:hypothetical protein